MVTQINLPQMEDHAIATLERIKIIDATPNRSTTSQLTRRLLPLPSLQRKIESLNETPFDLEAPADEDLHEIHQGEGGHGSTPPTVFYLAYGSNLCAETFRGKRGIRPLSEANVVVPELVMTFDMSGLPYLEPCFANTKYRDQLPPPSPEEEEEDEEGKGDVKFPLPSPSDDKQSRYRKTRWQKGLVGVVYEVSTEDYAKIISTEGGGASYNDILVTCYDLPSDASTVPLHPTTPPFKAHTLYCPTFPAGHSRLKTGGGRASRPDPNYAQPSARYLKLITDGADEHFLPSEYKDYLHQIRPYKLTTWQQKCGRFLFLGLWGPVVSPLFVLNRRLADKKGRAPWWLRVLLRAVMSGGWWSYDVVFRPLFGDGERTIGRGDDDDEEDSSNKKKVE